MTTKRTVQATSDGASDFQRSLDELARVAHGAPREIARAIRKHLEILDELGVFSGGAAQVVDDLETQHGREAAGLSTRKPKAPERHDRKRVPSGFVFAERLGILWPSTPTEWTDQGEQDEQIAAYLIDELSERARFEHLGLRRANLHAAYEGLMGYPLGEKWIDALTRCLAFDAEQRESARLREALNAGADESAAKYVAVWSDEEFVTMLERASIEPIGGRHNIPPDLTVDRIREMRGAVGVNKGGRHGKKTARTVVDEFVETIRKKRQRSADGNSG